jgi:long-subunit fatty acid transport protein
MKNTALLAASLLASASGAFAGGFDRSGQSIDAIFEDGNYAELSFGSISPDTEGTQVADGSTSGNVTDTYTQAGAAIKYDFDDKLSFALVIDQPYGADVNYGEADPSYLFTGSTATIDATSITSVLRYKFNDRFSVHGGLRNTSVSGDVTIPVFVGYNLETSTERDWSYLVGAAYEIPEIALRAAITYNSEINIDFATQESSLAGTRSDPLAVTLPQSVNLDFQTGIAANTLLMASVRWVDWTSTSITTDLFTASSGGAASDIVSYDDDTITYSLGIGRKFNDKWSGSFTIGYEASTGGFSANLGPTDGFLSASVGARYQATDTIAISGGITYVEIGDATTNLVVTEGDFTDNSAVGAGLKISYTF